MKTTKYEGAWDWTVEFKIPDEITEEEVANWICKHFGDHFVLTRHDWQIIAGGCTENVDSYDRRDELDRVFNPSADENGDHYQLNCYAKDLTLFSLRWGHEL